MNMEKIEAEIRMFDSIELIFAIGAAAAAAVLLIMIAAVMKRNEVKTGKGALIISLAVLAVTGIYTGTVVFADEESLTAENESLRMELIENAETPGDAAIEITGIASEDSCLKIIVADAEETAAEEAPAEEAATEEKPEGEAGMEKKTECEAGMEETAAAETPDPDGLEVQSSSEENIENALAEDVGAGSREQSEEAEETEAPSEEAEETEAPSEEAAEVREPSEEAAETGEMSEETETSSDETGSDASEDNNEGSEKIEGADAAGETDAESTCEISDPGETAERPVKEIEISLFCGAQCDDTAAREMIMSQQSECFDAAGLDLKDIVIEGGLLRSITFGLKETGIKYIRASLVFDGEMQEIEFILRKDEIEEAGDENGHNYNETPDDTETGGNAGGDDETVDNGNTTVIESGSGQQAGGFVPEDGNDDQGNSYEEGAVGEGQAPGENDENSVEGQAPAENDAENDEDPDPAEDVEKIEKDEEPPVIIIKPDDEGSGFKVSEDTKEAVSNVYISEAKEVRIIETNAEEIEDAEIVYTVNGETYPMEYGADYEIEKVHTDEGWRYEYVVAPHVFEKDGYYNINITSRDRSGNISNNKTAGTAVSFVVDRMPPAIIVTNLANGGVYKDDGHEYKVTLKDNTLLKYFRIYENKELKGEYRYDRQNWINTKDETDVLEAPGGTVTLRTDASGEAKTIEFEAEDESGNIYRSVSYNIVAGKSRSSQAFPFAVTAVLVTLAAAIAVKYYVSRRSAARQNSRGRR
ncbi:MAG: hypothetical protein IKR00_05595 [Lachnospiraceae bacterium]|nr:hypothetical protein [Lachnospiraceae bacterium]